MNERTWRERVTRSRRRQLARRVYSISGIRRTWHGCCPDWIPRPVLHATGHCDCTLDRRRPLLASAPDPSTAFLPHPHPPSVHTDRCPLLLPPPKSVNRSPSPYTTTGRVPVCVAVQTYTRSNSTISTRIRPRLQHHGPRTRKPSLPAAASTASSDCPHLGILHPRNRCSTKRLASIAICPAPRAIE
ncbi:hypothetical protein C8Q80DRAFT_225112 [Daedaleopsis nitida]|nr:hypothetical protein C8Q80DRAFT_225112 [Daedaleopsis nitida]